MNVFELQFNLLYIQIWIGVLHPVCYFVTSWSFESILSSILNGPQPYNKYHTKNRFCKYIEMSNCTTWYSFICRQQMTTKPTERPLNMKTSNILFVYYQYHVTHIETWACHCLFGLPITHMPISPYVLKNSIWVHAWIQPTVHVSFLGTGGITIPADARKYGVLYRRTMGEFSSMMVGHWSMEAETS